MKIPVKFVESVKSAASGAVAGMSLVTLTTLVIVLSGCIPPRAGTQSGTDSANQPAAQQPQNDAQTKPAPAASPSPTPGTGLASAEALKDETFLFSLVEAGTDPALPDGGVDLKAKVRDLHLTQVRGKVVCEDLILLRHPKRQMKPQFLVWDETDAGRRVIDLSFEHRIQDSMGVVHSANHRQTASFDPITRRWYLPLAQLVRGREHDVNSGELQRVTLEVIYEGGSRRDLEVDLRISGFLPELKVQEIAANHPEVSVQAFYRTFMFGALGVKKYRIQNPASRSVRLHLQLAPGSSLSMTSWILESFYREYGDRAPTPDSALWVSSGAVQSSQLRVTRRVGREDAKNVEAISAQGWTALTMEPGETMDVEVLAVSDPGVPKCVLPAPEVHRVQWEKPGRNARGETFGAESGATNVSHSWHVIGGRVSGQLGINIRISEIVTDLKRERLEEVSTVAFAQPLVAVGAQVGNVDSAARGLACQGTL